MVRGGVAYATVQGASQSYYVVSCFIACKLPHWWAGFHTLSGVRLLLGCKDRGIVSHTMFFEHHDHGQCEDGEVGDVWASPSLHHPTATACVCTRKGQLHARILDNHRYRWEEHFKSRE